MGILKLNLANSPEMNENVAYQVWELEPV